MEEMKTALSILAILVSLFTLWLTQGWKGRIKMTRPSLICFVFPYGSTGRPKIFMRTLLYSSSIRGRYVQNMYVRLHYGKSTKDFNVWYLGDDNAVRGSGLYASRSGVVCYHHFELTGKEDFTFLPLKYRIEVFVELENNKASMIFEQELEYSIEKATIYPNGKTTVFFNWEPNTKTYNATIESKSEIFIV